MGKILDLRKQSFGYLAAIEPTEERAPDKSIIWRCVCSCGNECFVSSSNLQNTHIQSCGCFAKEMCRQMGKARKTHGMTGTPTHISWSSMHQRCENPKSTGFKYYGGRGITICERWRLFENFFEDMGPRPEGKTLDRWPDMNGNYEPKNTRWSTSKEQADNRQIPKPKSCGSSKQYWFRAWHKDMMCQFMSINQNEFAKKHGLNQGNIFSCLDGRRKQTKGWSFRRVEI